MSLRPEDIRPIRGLTIAVACGVSATTAANLVSTVLYVMAYGLPAAPIDQQATEISPVEWLMIISALAEKGLFVVTAVLVIIWLFVARGNARAATGTVHRRHPAWIVFGWVTPVVGLWFPWQIVGDIWMASHPQTPDGGRDPWRDKRPAIVTWWWLSFLLATGVDRVGGMVETEAVTGADLYPYSPSLFDPSVMYVIGTALWIPAGILFIYIVHKISTFHEVRRLRRRQAMVMDGIGGS